MAARRNARRAMRDMIATGCSRVVATSSGGHVPNRLIGQHRFFIWTIGCQMNKADSERIAREFVAAGHQQVDNMTDATTVVLNGCAVRDNSDRKVWGTLGILKGAKKRKPHLLVGLTGCTVHADREELDPHLAPVDVLFDTLNTEPMLAAMARKAPADLPEYEDNEAITTMAAGGISRFVNIIYGCDKRCTYCIVPFRRGAQRSRPTPEILDEVRLFLDEGAREIVLLGQIVNAYGLDLDGTTLADLLYHVDKIPGIERIRFTTAHPQYLTRQLVEAMKDLSSVCEELNLPIQSGDNNVLKRMARGYNVEQYREKVALIRDAVPGIALSTDVIVGFCGESEHQFEQTLHVLDEIRFDQVHVAAFSARAGTIGSKWPDDVTQANKLRRLHLVERQQANISSHINTTYVGTVHDVLLEELVLGKGGDATPRWRGRTRTNKIVFCEAAPELSRGSVIPVTITAATPWSLRGLTAATVAA